MKPWMSIFLSAAVAVGAIATYDQIRGRDASSDRVAIATIPDLSEIEERLARLEAEEDPLLAGRGDQVILARVEHLERRFRALEAMPSAVPDSADRNEAAIEDPVAPDLLEPEGGLDPEAVERFRKLRGAAHREDRRRYREKQVAQALAESELRLTETQQKQLAEALDAFQSRRNEIWQEVKSRDRGGAEVDWPRVIQETEATIQREFAEDISEIVPHSADAAQLSSILMSSDYGK